MRSQMSPRRALAVVLAFLVAVTGLAVVTTAPPAAAAPLEVHVGSNVVNGRTLITRRIEVPYTTIEWYKTTTLTERPYEGWHRCERRVVRVLDTDFLSTLPHSSWTGYPNGYYTPSDIGVFYPRSPTAYTTSTVVDLAEYGAADGHDYGEGLGIVDGYTKTLLPEDSCGSPLPASDFKVPIVGVKSWDTAVDLNVVPVGGSTSLYHFTAKAEHPVVKDIAFTYLWWFEGGPNNFDGTGGTVATGPDVVANFRSTDPTSPNYRHWELWVKDENGEILANREGRMQSLDVSLTRPGTDPVRVGETFPVTLKVSAPADNPGALTAIKPVTSDLVLPDCVELVDGDLTDDFSLAPGESKTATLTLRATKADSGELVATWRGTDAFGGTVEGVGRLDLTAVGTFDGDWFRTDNLADSVRQGDTAPIRLRVENETGKPLTDVVLTDVSVTEPAEEGTEPAGGDDEAAKGIGGALLKPKPDALRGTLGATGPRMRRTSWTSIWRACSRARSSCRRRSPARARTARPSRARLPRRGTWSSGR